MNCFTLDAKYRNENPMDAATHMPRHRMGARGNATTFPLPWQDLLQQLETKPDLFRTGDELAEVVSIILKTSEEDDPKGSARFIHQAIVRRDVVVKLIVDAKARGHIAYKDVEVEQVRKKASIRLAISWCSGGNRPTTTAR